MPSCLLGFLSVNLLGVLNLILLLILKTDLKRLEDLLSRHGPLLKYTTKWLVLGKELRLDDESLNSILKKQQPDLCLGECLSFWFIKSKDDNKPAPLTWESFLAALQHAEEAEIALKIYEECKYSTKIVTNCYICLFPSSEV